jgi:hypothetical protein
MTDRHIGNRTTVLGTSSTVPRTCCFFTITFIQTKAMSQLTDALPEFIQAACVPLDSSHSSGTLERAEEIRRANPQLTTSNIYAAAILGDDAAA